MKLIDITELLKDISKDLSAHIPNSSKFDLLSSYIQEISEDLFFKKKLATFTITKNEKKINIHFPYKKLGQISSKDFFNLNELIFTSYYTFSKNIYDKFADIGACLGFHGIIFSKYNQKNVDFFEPDPQTFQILNEYIKLNDLKDYESYNKAVYFKEGQISFNRLDENNTGSHIAGSKENVYGSVSVIKVDTLSFDTLLKKKYNLIKMDIEGSELDIFKNFNFKNTKNFPDTYIEVHNKLASEIIYETIIKKLKLNIFSQNLGWSKLININDMPFHYSHGSILVSQKNNLLWKS